MEENGVKGLVSVVKDHVKDKIHRHMVVVVDSPLEVVVAMMVDQALVAPPIFDCSNLDAYSCYSFHSFQHYWNQTQSDGGES